MTSTLGIIYTRLFSYLGPPPALSHIMTPEGLLYTLSYCMK